jgi:hypothetical protein
MNDQISLSTTQVDNFKSVWFELLKKKIAIIYDISNHKNVDFMELLNEFVPEALEHKSEWEDLYIIKDIPNIKKYNLKEPNGNENNQQIKHQNTHSNKKIISIRKKKFSKKISINKVNKSKLGIKKKFVLKKKS